MPIGVWVLWENKAMVRKQDGLVPIGEALADMDGPVQALQRATLAQRGFTQADQGTPACFGQ